MPVTATDATALLGDQLIRVMRLLAAAKLSAPRVHPEVEPTAYALLFALHQEPRRVSELAEIAHNDISTVSRQIKHLDGLGFIARARDETDGRAQVLSLTDEGVDLLRRLREGRNQWVAQLVADWETSERLEFTAHLSRFADGVETYFRGTTRTEP